MNSETKWPDWKNVAAGLPIDGAHVCAWPTPSHDRPQLAIHQQNKPRRLVKIDFLPVLGSIAGYKCEQGINYLLVYEDEIPQIRKRIATDEQKRLLALAEETFEFELAAFIKERTRNGRGPTRAEAIQEFHLTPWNILHRNHRNVFPWGYPKVLSLEVCPDPVPPPPTATSLAQEAADRNAETLGRAIAMALEERDRRKGKNAAA